MEALDSQRGCLFFLELRITRALYAMGHGHRRSPLSSTSAVAAPCGSEGSTEAWAAPFFPPVLAAVERLYGLSRWAGERA